MRSGRRGTTKNTKRHKVRCAPKARDKSLLLLRALYGESLLRGLRASSATSALIFREAGTRRGRSQITSW